MQGRCMGWINAVQCFGARPSRWQLVMGLKRKQGQATPSISSSLQCIVNRRKGVVFLSLIRVALPSLLSPAPELQLVGFTSLNGDASGTGISSSAGTLDSFSGEKQAPLGCDSSHAKPAVSSRSDELCPKNISTDYMGCPVCFTQRW